MTTSLRQRAATLALAVTVVLTAFKVAGGLFTHSVGVFSEGIHSFLDLVSAAVAFFTIREAGKAADWDHPYGHGKIETLSSLFESLLLVAAAGLIIFEAIEHLQHPEAISHPAIALTTILVSMGVSYWIFRNNTEIARQTDSSAIQVNALHFLSDVVAGAGVLVGLILMRLTGWLIIDPLMAFAVAGYILLVSAKQVKAALMELSDQTLPVSEVQQIQKVLDHFKDRAIDAHDLRTRKSGSTRHIDFHLVTCGQMSVNESHGICDEMESRINHLFPSTSVNIHVEPCEHENVRCHKHCRYYLARLGQTEET